MDKKDVKSLIEKKARAKRKIHKKQKFDRGFM